MEKNTAKEKVEYMIKAMEGFLEFNEKESLSDKDAHRACNIMFAEFLVDSLIEDSESISISQKQNDHSTVVSLGFLTPDGEKMDEKVKEPITWLKPYVMGT